MISFYPKVKEVSVLHRNDPVLKVDDPIFFELMMMTMIGMLSSSSSSNTIVKSLLSVATTTLEVSSSVNSHLFAHH